MGPIVPNPGPVFPSDAITALADVTGSVPVKVITIVPIMKINK